MDIQKNTNNDKRRMLDGAIEHGYLTDFDDSFVYIERYTEEGYKHFKVSYTMSDTAVTLGDDEQEVVKLTEFKDVETSTDKSLTNTIINVLDKYFGSSKKNTHQVIKQFDEEEMIAIEPLYIAADDVDLQGDTISLEDTHGLVDSLNKAIKDGRLQSGIAHKHSTETFSIEKGWVNEVTCVIGETTIPAGQPIAKVKFHNQEAWELRKAGELCGLSIGARAKEIEVLDD